MNVGEKDITSLTTINCWVVKAGISIHNKLNCVWIKAWKEDLVLLIFNSFYYFVWFDDNSNFHVINVGTNVTCIEIAFRS